jgi:hypothetical protein
VGSEVDCAGTDSALRSIARYVVTAVWYGIDNANAFDSFEKLIAVIGSIFQFFDLRLRTSTKESDYLQSLFQRGLLIFNTVTRSNYDYIRIL